MNLLPDPPPHSTALSSWLSLPASNHADFPLCSYPEQFHSTPKLAFLFSSKQNHLDPEVIYEPLTTLSPISYANGFSKYFFPISRVLSLSDDLVNEILSVGNF